MIEIQIDTLLKELLSDNKISHIDGIDIEGSIQPSSLDVNIGSEGYLVKGKFSPYGKKIVDILETEAVQKVDISNGATLFKGQTYVFPCLNLDIPKDMYVQCSPKSSIGRVDLLIRAIFDNSGLYDRSDKGYKGALWIEISPQSFNVQIEAGMPLIQFNLGKDVDYSLDLLEEDGVFTGLDNNDSPHLIDAQTMVLGLRVPQEGVIGYEARETNKPLDLRIIGEADPLEYFKPVEIAHGSKNGVALEKDHFYIMATSNRVAVPPRFTAEMLPLSHYIGELRAHYAGYFDPGFGYGNEGEVGGNIGVLEVRPYEKYTYYHGQPICLFRYYRNSGTPDRTYGYVNNNYAEQKGVKLAKYFKEID
jgi:dCTP deaminase